MSNPFDPIAHLREVGIRSSTDEKPYILTDFSVNPQRVVGIDEWGVEITESIPVNFGRLFVHPSGCVNNVPTTTNPGNRFMPENANYTRQLLRDLIRDKWLPLDECPYSLEYRSWVGGPLVEPPPGEAACNGEAGGCRHMKAEIEKRLAVSRKRHDRLQDQLAGTTPAESAALLKRLSTALDHAQERASRAEPEATDNTQRAPRRPSMKGSE